VLAEARAGGAGRARDHLLGQNVNAWHGEAPDGSTWGARPAAARELAEIPGPGCGCATPPRTRATWTTTLIAAHRDMPR
jgi:tRNA-2-methylthio-N6-dimethylallyladenosine synthase